MSKISRGFRINRNQDVKVEDEWAAAFEKELNKVKSAVKSKDESVSSLFNQINSIVNKKSKYSSVEDAVRDMQERSGYASYLRNVQSQNEESNQKTAQFATQNPHANIPDMNDSNDMPGVIRAYPSVRNTLENCIRDTHGFLPIPAVIERVKRIHKNDVSDDKLWNDDDFIKYVGKLNLQEKSNHSQSVPEHNLGKNNEITEDVNSANTNFFGGCEPTKV